MVLFLCYRKFFICLFEFTTLTVTSRVMLDVTGKSKLSLLPLKKKQFKVSLSGMLAERFFVFSLYQTEVIDISPAIFIPACPSSSPAFRMVCSAYKLNKQGDNIQPWCTPFPIRNQSVVPCPVLTVASWPAYRFLRRQVRYSYLFKNFPHFIVIHSLNILWHYLSSGLGWKRPFPLAVEMLDSMKHKGESRLPGEISITSDMHMTPPLWQKVKKN